MTLAEKDKYRLMSKLGSTLTFEQQADHGCSLCIHNYRKYCVFKKEKEILRIKIEGLGIGLICLAFEKK